MKKLLLVLLFVPFITQASFDVNIKYGTKGSDNVREIQEFLTGEGVYSGPITGNFYALTLKGIKTFQAREGIKADGYWGPATRSRANELLKNEIGEGEENAFLTSENLPTSSNEVAFKFGNGESFNFNGKSLSPAVSETPIVIDFCNNLPGSQSILPPNNYRSEDNNCYAKVEPGNVSTPATPVVIVAPTVASTKPVITEFSSNYDHMIVGRNITLYWEAQNAVKCIPTASPTIAIPFTGYSVPGALKVPVPKSEGNFRYFLVCADKDWNTTNASIDIKVVPDIGWYKSDFPESVYNDKW